MKAKYKIFSKYNNNILDHPKLKFNRLTSKKWLKLKTHLPRRLSEYGRLLEAKQKLRCFYGNLKERKFLSLYKESKKLKGNSGVNFIKLLERRLDTVLFRSGFGNSFDEVRQLISHKHILVNDEIINISSYNIKEKDIISLNPKSSQNLKDNIKISLESALNFKSVEKLSFENFKNLNPVLLSPNYISRNLATLEIIYLYSPELEEVTYPIMIDLDLVMQYYEYQLHV